jgi:hypothetical protein
MSSVNTADNVRVIFEWLRGENRFEAKRGIAPNQHQEMRKTNRTLL